jgi:hypothetical protein
MKKTTFFAAALLLVALVTLNPTQAHAQKYKGQTVITGAAGYSLTGILFNVIKEGLNTVGDINATKTPVIMGGVDYGITDRFSIGAVYTYQGLTAKYGAYETTDSAGNIYVVNGDFTDRLTRQSIGIRPLFHLGDNDDLDMYVGARLSYVFWSYNSNRPDASGLDIVNGFGSPIKPQFIFGLRYFFIPNVGFNTEVAIGPTYLMTFGINARFGGM